MHPNRRIRLIKFLAHSRSYLVAAIDIIYQGIGLGLLDHDDFNALTELRYTSPCHYQNDEYNLSGFFNWERDAVDQFFNNCESILIGAVGGGREIIAFSNRGIMADGFECNPNLINECRHLIKVRGIESKVVRASPDDVPAEFGIYDGIIVGWGGYMFIPGRESRIRFLKLFREHVKPNGPLLLSFFSRRGDSRTTIWRWRIAAFLRFLRRCREKIELGDGISSNYYYHEFTEKEIESELHEAGYELIYYSEKEYPHAIARYRSK